MSDRPPIAAPSNLLLALEQRVIGEYAAFLAAAPALRLIGRGDRHPVLVLPGFGGADSSTQPLRWILRGQGYFVHGWGLGANLGPTTEIVDGVRQRLVTLRERHGTRVSLVGQSAGGMFARELARHYPDAVRQVIMLGSPFRYRSQDRTVVSPIAERIRHRYVEWFPDAALPEEDRAPVPVPVTAIYSRSDGVARWYGCIESEGTQRENIEVYGSHTGLAVHPAAILAVSDRLAQPDGQWRPFKPPRSLAHLFPTPVTWKPRTEQVSRRPAGSSPGAGVPTAVT